MAPGLIGSRRRATTPAVEGRPNSPCPELGAQSSPQLNQEPQLQVTTNGNIGMFVVLSILSI